MMTFSQLNIGQPIHVLEVVGTFKKSTTYYRGMVTSVSKIYEEQLPPQQFPMPKMKQMLPQNIQKAMNEAS